MNKLNSGFLGLLIMAGLLASCSQTVMEEEIGETLSEQTKTESEENVTDLSEVEMANCYIVRTPGLYEFKADNQFNLGEGLPVPQALSVKSAKLVWQTVNGSISTVELSEKDGQQYIRFEVAKAEGNAVLAALDSEGNVEWSWHIWMPSENVAPVKLANGYEVMNMNLGAMCNTPGDAASYGMLYQWGRKDPFPAAATLTGNTSTVSAPTYDIDGNPVGMKYSSWSSDADNTIAYAIANPTVCLSNYSHYSTSRDWLKISDDTLWGNPQGYERDPETNAYINFGQKTCYDPSPAGWRVGPADVFSEFTSTGGYSWSFADFNVADVNKDGVIDLNDYNYGWHFLTGTGSSLYFPAAARFDGSYAMLMGSMSGLWGNYWTNSPFSSSVNEVQGQAFCGLSFSVKDQSGNEFIAISPAGGASRADAYSIRCIRDVEKGGDSSGVPKIKF